MPVYKDPATSKWYVKFGYKNRDGKWKTTTKRGFSKKKDALEWEAENRKSKNGSLEMSFKSFGEVYLEDIRPRIKVSTFEIKKNILQKRLVPFFGDTPMCDISSLDVMRWQNKMLEYRTPDTEKPYSKSYLQTLHCQLSAVFNHAMRYYGLKENPARTAGSIGTESEIQMKFWTREQYKVFAEVMMEYPMEFYCYEMLYWTGIREGELLALCPEDFDFAKKTVRINKTYHRIHGVEVVTEPKSPKSNRTVSMPDFLCEEIQEYMDMTYIETPSQRVFPTTKNHLFYMIHKGAEMADLPQIRVHDLRHSHVSLLIDMGFSALAIADRVGHEAVDITYKYAHLFPSVQDKMASQLNEMRGVS